MRRASRGGSCRCRPRFLADRVLATATANERWVCLDLVHSGCRECDAGSVLVDQWPRRAARRRRRTTMTIQRMDNVLIVVDDLEAAKAFFVELGMELEGETTVEGPAVDRLIGLQNVRATLALLRTPDGHGRIELDKFHTPEAIRTGPEHVPVNALGIRRILFAVDDL